MRKRRETISVRVDTENYAYLRATAMMEGLSLTESLAKIIEAQEKQSGPVQFRIERWLRNDGNWYVLALGYCDIQYPTLPDAKRGLDELRSDNRLCARRFPLCPEIAVKDYRDPPPMTEHSNDAP